MERYILMLQPNFQGILRLEIRLNKLNELDFVYELWKITGKLPNSIIYSLQNNPLSRNVFDSISNKELMIRGKLLLGEAQRLYVEIIKKLEIEKKKLIEREEDEIKNEVYICVQFPLLKTYLTYDQLLGVSSFLNQFISSYDVIKISLMNNKKSTTENPVKIEGEKNNNDFERQSSDNVDFANTDIMQLLGLSEPGHKIKTDAEAIETTIGRKLIRETLSIIKDNPILVLFVCKLIHNELETGIYTPKLEELVEYKETEEGKLFNFKFDPLLGNNSIFSKPHTEELIGVLDTLNKYAPEEIIGKLHLLVKYFKYVIEKYIKNKELEEQEVAFHIILPLKIIQFLLFCFSFKYSSKLTYGHIKPEKIGDFINYLSTKAIDFIGHKHGLIFDEKIIFNNPRKPLTDTYEYPDCLYEAFDKYEYLLTVDKDAFVNYVFNDISLNLTQIETNEQTKVSCACSIDKVLLTLPLNNKKIINIPTILKQNEEIPFSKLPNSYISYKNLKKDKEFYTKYNYVLTQSIYDNSTIITKEYFDILKLLNLPSTTSSTFLLQSEEENKNINPIILRYADVITNSIFHELTLDDFYNTPVSTLYLISQFILPNIPNTDFTIEVLLFILYRVVIPYIVDMFKVREVIDYFH